MNQIGTIQFDFNMQNEQFARDLYGRWDRFFAQNVERIADEILLKYEISSEHVEINRLDIQIGTLSEAEFDEKFPFIFREKLEEALFYVLQNPQMQGVSFKRTSNEINACDILCTFLLTGTWSWNASSRFKSLSELFLYVLEKESLRFQRFLQTYGHYTSLQERFVYQLQDPELEAGIRLLAPSETTFICSYVRFLIAKYKQIDQPDIRETDHRHAVWLVVYAYLLNNGSSSFNRKSFVTQTIFRLAAKYNTSYEQLLTLLTREMEQFLSIVPSATGLFQLLNELKTGISEQNFRESAASAAKLYKILSVSLQADSPKKITPKSRKALIELLAEESKCRQFLRLLKEEEIIRLVPIVIPEESDFVISYARELDESKEKGALEGKTGGEFRLLKWEIIFPLLLGNPAASFNRRYFVEQVLRNIAAHYNLEVEELVAYFYEYCLRLGVNQQLINILSKIQNVLISKKIDFQGMVSYKTNRYIGQTKQELENITPAQRAELIAQLSSSQSRRIYLATLREPEIFTLVSKLFPTESRFISAYARNFDRPETQGFLEGKTIGNFHVLKWEFIFSVLTEDKGLTVNRHYFIESTLKKIAAHYNLAYVELLSYLYKKEIIRFFPYSVEQIIAHLHQKEISKSTRSDANPKFSNGQSSDSRAFQLLEQKYPEFARSIYYLLQQYSKHPDAEKIQAFLLEFVESTDWQQLTRVEIEQCIQESIHQSEQSKTSSENDCNNQEMDSPVQNDEPILFNENQGERLYINNAGLVLLSPYLPRLFTMLELTSDGKFVSRDAQIRAMFLLQYIVFESVEFPEYEMTFNKLLTGFQTGQPIPRSIELTEKEKDTVNSMLQAVLQHWSKMKNTSLEGLRQGFLQRDGRIETNDNGFSLTVEPKAYDMLLDSVPWSYNPVKFAWVEKPIHVKWR